MWLKVVPSLPISSIEVTVTRASRLPAATAAAVSAKAMTGRVNRLASTDEAARPTRRMAASSARRTKRRRLTGA
jgi:hypothetical protein